MSSTLFAVLGLGSIGMRHAGNLINLGQNVIGFDPRDSRMELFQKAGGTPAASKEEAMEQADAVLICTPNHHHLADIGIAVDQGKHIFVEKPLSHTLVHLVEILGKAERDGLVVFHGLNLRFHPAVVRAREEMIKETIGRPLWARMLCTAHLPDWRPYEDYRQGYTTHPIGGGALLDNIHEFDLIFHLLGPGKIASSVAQNTGYLDLETEDCADVVISHTAGLNTSFHLDYVTTPHRRMTEISGTKGLLELDIKERRLVVSDRSGTKILDETFPGAMADDYITEMRSFIDCISGKALPSCTNDEAVSVLKQVLQARSMSGLPS